jgi:hypothetical protein
MPFPRSPSPEGEASSEDADQKNVWQSGEKPSYFHLLSFNIKVLGYAPSGVMVHFQGIEIPNSVPSDPFFKPNVYDTSLKFVSEGYHPVIKIDFAQMRAWQGRISVVEWWAETEEKSDWRFCIDDIVVDFVGDSG